MLIHSYLNAEMSTNTKKIPDYQLVDGYLMPGAFSADAFRETLAFKVRPTDLCVATYPKCGTTWTQVIMGLLRNDGKPYPTLSDFMKTIPFLEFTGTEFMESVKDPRAFKVHLPFDMTPYSPDTKYIVVVRNPKDCLVSYFHHTRTLFYGFEDGEFDTYFDLFMAGEVDYGDYFDHILSWYEHRKDPNVFFICYEEMKADPRGSIVRMANFMGPKYSELVKNEQKLDDIVKYSSFNFMKSIGSDNPDDPLKKALYDNNPAAAYSEATKHMLHVFKYIQDKYPGRKDDMTLTRKGIVGDWRNVFSDEQNRRMNEKIEAKLKGTELLEYWNSIGCL